MAWPRRPFPPGLASDPTLFLAIWLAGDPDIVEISGGGAQFGGKRPLTLEGSNAGVYLVSTARHRPLEGTIFSVTITGPRLVTNLTWPRMSAIPTLTTRPRPAAWAAGLPCCMSQRRRLERHLDLIAGNVVCPETGALEFYFEGLTGTRQGGVAYARIPVARIRGAVSALAATYSNDNANLLAIPHGANRGVGVAVQATTNS